MNTMCLFTFIFTHCNRTHILCGCVVRIIIMWVFPPFYLFFKQGVHALNGNISPAAHIVFVFHLGGASPLRL